MDAFPRHGDISKSYTPVHTYPWWRTLIFKDTFYIWNSDLHFLYNYILLNQCQNCTNVLFSIQECQF